VSNKKPPGQFKPRAPDYLCFTPCGEGGPVKWRQVGEAWINKDTGSITQRIDLPVQRGVLVMHPFDKARSATPTYDDIPPPGDEDAPFK